MNYELIKIVNGSSTGHPYHIIKWGDNDTYSWGYFAWGGFHVKDEDFKTIEEAAENLQKRDLMVFNGESVIF